MKKISFSIILCLFTIIAISQSNYVQGTIIQDANNANIVDIYGLTTGSYNYAIQELDFVISIPNASSTGVTVALASNALTAATYGGSWTTYSSVQDAQNTYFKFRYYNATATTPFSFSSNTAVQLATVSFTGGTGSAQIGLTDQLSTSSLTYLTYKWYISVKGDPGNDGSGGISSTNYHNPSLNNAIYYANAGKSTMGPNTGNAQYVSTIHAIPLPISLINFTAVKASGKVNLAWAIAAKANIASFLVQRSRNCVDFEPVVSTIAVGSGADNYTAVDANPLTGISFYRLKNINIDRYFTYSNIVSINFNENYESNDLSVYPSPANSFINVVVSTPSLYGTVCTLVDFSGHIINSFTITGNAQQVNISNLVTGMYFIKLANGSAVKFIKN